MLAVGQPSKRRCSTSRGDRVLERIQPGTADANILFAGMRELLRRLGFEQNNSRQPSHLHKGRCRGNPELAPKGGRAKAYQIKQDPEV